MNPWLISWSACQRRSASARRGVDVLDVLLDQLPAVRAQRGIEELDRGDAVEVDVPARLAHPVERSHHVLLAPDHVERRQLAQPAGRRFRRQERIGMIPCLLGQEIRTWLSVLERSRNGAKHRRTRVRDANRSAPRATIATIFYSPIRSAAQKCASVGYNRASRKIARDVLAVPPRYGRTHALPRSLEGDASCHLPIAARRCAASLLPLVAALATAACVATVAVWGQQPQTGSPPPLKQNRCPGD